MHKRNIHHSLTSCMPLALTLWRPLLPYG